MRTFFIGADTCKIDQLVLLGRFSASTSFASSRLRSLVGRATPQTAGIVSAPRASSAASKRSPARVAKQLHRVPDQPDARRDLVRRQQPRPQFRDRGIAPFGNVCSGSLRRTAPASATCGHAARAQSSHRRATPRQRLRNIRNAPPQQFGYLTNPLAIVRRREHPLAQILRISPASLVNIPLRFISNRSIRCLPRA